MSQAADAWIKIIREVFREFNTVDMTGGEPSPRPQVNHLYPELRMALMDRATREEDHSHLYRQAGITLLVIDLDEPPSREALAELRTALSTAARLTAQRPMRQETKFSLLKRIAAAKSVCEGIADGIPAAEGMKPSLEVWEEKELEAPAEPAAVPAAAPPAVREAEPAAVPKEPVPVQAGERIEFVDILRGFALIGVLVANMSAFSGRPRDLGAFNGLDTIVDFLATFLVEAKFYSLFSLLFGWGMAMQMTRAQARGTQFVPVYVRRLLILLAFGAIHGALIWTGDILTMYALLGFLLLVLRKLPKKLILVGVGLMLLLGIVRAAPGEAMDTVRTWCDIIPGCIRSDSNLSESLYATGTLGEIARLRFHEYRRGFWWLPCYIGNVFAMFLLGLYIGKRRIFQNVQRHLPLLRRVLWVGLVIGVVFNGIFASAVAWRDRVPAEYWRLIAVGARTIGAPALMLFYVSGIILLLRKKKWQDSLAPLGSVGRSALSNYLLQSVVCTLIFYNYGLGLYGEMGSAFGLVLSAIIFVVQIRLSDWWFDSHQFGPVESLWRVLTYGRLRPSRPGEEKAPSRVQRVRQAGARVPTIAWVGLGLVLVVAVGLSGYWILQPRDEGPAAPGLPGEITPTPMAAQESGQPGPSSGEVGISVTPEVRPVAFDPGPIAASGDLAALAATFGVEEAYAHIEELSGPRYSGRYAGTAGGWAAGDYLAEQFARYGLQPAGDGGTFFQSFSIEPAALAEEPTLVIEGPDGTVYDQFRPDKDYTALAGWYSGSGSTTGPVVWANSCAHDDFDGLDVVGKVVLCRDASGATTGAQTVESAGRNAVEHGATGLLLLADPEQHPPYSGVVRRQTWVPVPIPTFRVYPSLATKLLLESGKSLTDLALQYTSFPLHTRVRMEVETIESGLCPAEECEGRNVLGVIPGRDPALADQVVIVGAHYDQLGRSPTGLTWAGANDNASGVAVLLQIAQSWHRQGYVPRRTVLFAAWDAYELDQAGSQHYVAHPRYPLDDTIAEIEVMAVGAGGDTLSIGGAGELAERIRAVAEAMGYAAKTESTETGDHQAFLNALVPATLLSWSSAENPPPYRNRPEDTPEIIDLDKLRASGRITGIALLGLTEGEPAIWDLLDRRANALLEGDLAGFLATSLPEREGVEESWFADAQSFAPSAFEMEASEVKVLGETATAVVRMTLTYPTAGEGDQTLTKRAWQEVRFVHGEDGWRWAGPSLVPMESDGGFDVEHPSGQDGGLDGLGGLAAAQYREAASRLGLPTAAEATLLLFPSAESLRASTALSMMPDQDEWVGPGRIKLVYSPGISTSQTLPDTVIQLLLAEAGVTESAAPWLWQGLPPVVRGEEDPVGTQRRFLGPLHEGLAEGEAPSEEAASWAAMDYLRREIGWERVGQLITDLGRACREGLCEDSEGADQALLNAVNMDTAAFEEAWQADWEERLAVAQASLDAALAARREAALAGDEAAFLNTVEPSVPHLMTEEQHWLDALTGRAVESLVLTGEPAALLEDGSILADVTLQYELGGVAGQWREGEVPLTILFTPGGEGYRWAGPPFGVTAGDQISVCYPAGRDELAQGILEEAETIYTQLAAELGVEEPETLAIKLYDNHSAFRTSVFLSFPLANWIPGWTEAGESVKLRLDTGAPPEAYRSALAVQLARRLLYQMGVDAEWLVHGTSIYFSRGHDGGSVEQRAASSLDTLAREIRKERLAGLSSIPPVYRLSEEGFALASAQAWDAVRYLVTAHGREALTGLLGSLEEGAALETALRRVTGQGLSGFESAWAESAVRAHAAPGWVDTALAFDPERAYRHVAYLASPELAGRQAGSPGAEAAAAYIAELFASYGLVPAGEDDTYFQSFPISYTAYVDLPQLDILDANGQLLATVPFRDEFLPLFNEASDKAEVEGELVWVPDTYQGLDLSGKVVLCRPSDSVNENIGQAVDHGAIGVIIIGSSENRKEYLSKQPIPIRYPAEDAVPVLELTQNGHEHLLEVTGLTPPVLFDAPPALPLGFRARIRLPVSTPASVQTANVLGLLPGADPILGEELIIVSAHYDHVGDDPGSRRYSGANDNASGVGVLLEMARLWHETGYRPKRSVLFVAWGAQELGMVGSRYYLEHALFPLEETVAMVQLDAVGGGSGHYMEVQGFREQEGLLMFNMQVAEDLVDGRLKLAMPAELDQPVEEESERELYLSPFEGLGSMLLNTQPSDQAVFHQFGIPAVLVTWRGANEDNWPDEIAEEVEPYRLDVTGRMVTLVLMTVADEYR